MLDLVHGSGPFDRLQSDTSCSDKKHLAHIISILAPPPVDMLRQAKNDSDDILTLKVSFHASDIGALLILVQINLSIQNLSHRVEDLTTCFQTLKSLTTNSCFLI